MNRKLKLAYRILLASIFAALLSSGSAVAEKSNTVVVTTSMLEAAVYDAVRGGAPPHVVRLIPPGSCPGHFDLKPKMLMLIKEADLFILHNYQRGIERKVAGLKADVPMMIVEENGSYLIPSNYVKVVNSIKHSLAREKREGRVGDSVESRMRRLEKSWKLAAKKNEWAGVPVIASSMQADFCRWLGFNVVKEIARPTKITPGEIDKLLHTEAELVIGNRQSDIAAARRLAKRLEVPVVGLSNFPKGAVVNGRAYEHLAAENLNEMERAWAQR